MDQLDQVQQQILTRRAARLCVLGMQSLRYSTDLEYKDALDALWEMIPEPVQLVIREG